MENWDIFLILKVNGGKVLGGYEDNFIHWWWNDWSSGIRIRNEVVNPLGTMTLSRNSYLLLLLHLWLLEVKHCLLTLCGHSLVKTIDELVQEPGTLLVFGKLVLLPHVAVGGAVTRQVLSYLTSTSITSAVPFRMLLTSNSHSLNCFRFTTWIIIGSSESSNWIIKELFGLNTRFGWISSHLTTFLLSLRRQSLNSMVVPWLHGRRNTQLV